MIYPTCVQHSGGAMLRTDCLVANRRSNCIAPTAEECAGGACDPHASGAAVARVRPPAPGARLPACTAARIWGAVAMLCFGQM